MSLILENVTIERGGRVLLSGVSFALDPARALVLRGPNGVGKTTLLRSIAGLQSPLSGRITCKEDDLVYAAHSDGIKAMLTVRENLLFWAQIYGHHDIEHALQAFDLQDLSDRFAAALSAGQKRRLGLARLLISKRQLWILDEPTVSLDAQTVKLFASIVDQHLSKGGSAVMATHIDLGIDQPQTLDLEQYCAAKSMAYGTSDEAFL